MIFFNFIEWNIIDKMGKNKNLEDEKDKKILIIGNGFDLAHGLPTKYTDFLEFCKCVELIFDEKIDINKFNHELEKWNPKPKTKEEYITTIEQNIEEIKNNNKNDEEYIIELILQNIKEYKENTKKEAHKKDSEEDNKENNFDSKQKNIENTEIIKNKLLNFFENRKEIDKQQNNEINSKIYEIHDLIKENFWYHYLVKTYRQNRIKNNDWVDFESEIKHVIKKIDEESENNLLTKFQKLFPKIQKKDPKIKNIYFDRELENINIENTTVIKDCKTVGDFRKKSYEALLELTRALELYFAVFIENKEIINNQIKLQIDNSKDNCDDKKDDFDFPIANYIINFNYTNTYERYSNNQDNNEKICYIHGKCDSKHNIKENNMVLGIDNYWEKEKSKKDKDKDKKDNKRDNCTNFTIFRKLAQRIQKNTDNKYYDYLENIKNWEDKLEKKDKKETLYKIYMFGHSLDLTDKDILEQFISSKATDVTIYSHTKENIGNLIENTIKLIGEEKLFKKLKKGTIKFKVQNLKQERETQQNHEITQTNNQEPQK